MRSLTMSSTRVHVVLTLCSSFVAVFNTMEVIQLDGVEDKQTKSSDHHSPPQTFNGAVA